ncbi:uncharacterized protein LOC128648167 [Bombina bombina]|uniref:uncharacterized protein LOC128648167 n=1 Tax=Bombina bombina TaxID=8345 RepID=UPI00235B2ADB|nr:uncharacterized protein LOC128648167 [Bombina bombina]
MQQPRAYEMEDVSGPSPSTSETTFHVLGSEPQQTHPPQQWQFMHTSQQQMAQPPQLHQLQQMMHPPQHPPQQQMMHPPRHPPQQQMMHPPRHHYPQQQMMHPPQQHTDLHHLYYMPPTPMAQQESTPPPTAPTNVLPTVPSQTTSQSPIRRDTNCTTGSGTVPAG